MNYKISIYIGYIKEEDSSKEFKSKCCKIIEEYYPSFNIIPCFGFYKKKEIDCLKMEIYTNNVKDINRLCLQLKKDLKQKSILYEKEKSIYKFI